MGWGGRADFTGFIPSSVFLQWSAVKVAFLSFSGDATVGPESHHVDPPPPPPLLRLGRGLTTVSVTGMTTWGGVTRLSYRVENGGSTPCGGKPMAMKHEAGQYAFLNVGWGRRAS